MFGFRLTLEALFTLTTNFWTAVQVSFLPLAILWGISLAGMAWITGGVSLSQLLDMADPYSGNGTPPPGIWALIAVLLVTYALCMAWIAVTWHRFFLRSEAVKSLVPPFHFRRTLGYILRGILVAMVLIPIGLVFGFFSSWIISVALTMWAGSGVMLFLSVFFFVTEVIVAYILLRVSLILPGWAIDRPLGVGESIHATGKFRLQVLGGAVMVTAAQWLFTSISNALFELPTLALIVQLGTDWITIMFGLAFLSVLYRYAILPPSADRVASTGEHM